MRLRRRAAALRAHLPASLPYQPWSVLVPLVVVEWLGLVYEVRRHVPHNGWLFGRGRTETMHATTGWLLAHGRIPHALVGYGWPLVLAPLTWFTGPAMTALLPYVVVAAVVLLLPLGALGAYVLGARSAGRLVGYFAAGIWTLGPFASLWYVHLHQRDWHDRVVPQLLGLTARPELPATCVLLLAGVLVLRALDGRGPRDALAAGAVAGIGVALMSENVLFLAAPVIAFALARRPRELGAFAAGLVPTLVTYAVWSERATGHLSLLLPHHDFSWAQLKTNWYYLLTVTWSPRVLEWLVVAGFIGLVRAAPVKAVFLGVWVAPYALAEGTTRALKAEETPFWHLFMPAFPALCVLVASLPLLWPRAAGRLPARFPYVPRRVVPLLWPVLAVAVVPLVWVLAASPLHDGETALRIPPSSLFVPVRGPRATATATGRRVTVSWRPMSAAHARTAYAVYRSPAGRDTTCTTDGAIDCASSMKWVGTTRATSWSEKRGAGTFAYRVAVIASARGVKGHPALLIGPRATVRVSR